MRRRPVLIAALMGAAASPARTARAADGPSVVRGRTLRFPRDHGAHLDARTEWWYLTGWRGPMAAPTHGYQVTFFRSRTGLAPDSPSRFAPRHLLFAHAAITDLGAGTHRHAECMARWRGDPADGVAAASLDDAHVHIGRWHLARNDTGWNAQVDDPAQDLSLALRLRQTQPLLLQGDAGWSQKGPSPAQASHYVTAPQLQDLDFDGGRAWLDHEWSDEILQADAVGWDWAGINLADGGALTVFRLRRANGSVLWSGGSWRRPDGSLRTFAPGDVHLQPGRTWRSGATAAIYPVTWTLETPAGRHDLRALLDAQELDARVSTGTVYWEGLSALHDAQGSRVGLGYLEMTGYAGRLRLS